MKYMLLLFAEETWMDDPNYDETEEMKLHAAFSRWCADEGIDVPDGQALKSSRSATTVRKATNEEVSVTEGPALEIREQIGGYYIVNCRDLDQAIDVARRVPSATTVEIRPLFETGGPDE